MTFEACAVATGCISDQKFTIMKSLLFAVSLAAFLAVSGQYLYSCHWFFVLLIGRISRILFKDKARSMANSNAFQRVPASLFKGTPTLPYMELCI